MFCVMGALQLITWMLTHGRAARGSPTTAYINTLLRDTMLGRREIEPNGVCFLFHRLIGVDQKKEITILSNELCEEMETSTQNNNCRKYDAKIFIIIYILRYTHWKAMAYKFFFVYNKKLNRCFAFGSCPLINTVKKNKLTGRWKSYEYLQIKTIRKESY